MKFLWLGALLAVLCSPVSYAQTQEVQRISILRSIDDLAPLPAATEASEEGLPHREFLKLLDFFDFTILSEARVQELFSELERNPQARNAVAGGNCAVRRNYIQNYFKKKNIISGSLLIDCPFNDGRMTLVDQVTGRRHIYSNFHDVNIVSVPDGYRVLDVQFESGPVTLSSYLAEVEASQKIKPLNERSSRDRGYCYWSIRP